MTNFRLALASLFMLLTASISSAEGKPERILGYLPTKSGVIFQVASGGCTHRSDFFAKLKRAEGTDIAELILVRTTPDLCYPFIPSGERFKFSYKELGIAPSERFIVKNENGIVLGWIWPETLK